MGNINIRFPINDDINGNTYVQLTQATKDALSSNLMLLLLTDKGERYYDPDYGTNLLKFIFEPNDSITSADIESEIKRVVMKYIPQLTISKVDFINLTESNEEVEYGGGNQLKIKIKFVYSEDAFSESGEVDLTF